ncbi:hypothetical protein BJ741DRAFT_617788 [Chytriomyces cf. hyalinus JEL632]|nr:hypothetical protein BJ741DRAFT_617788 [Chytriomyces cf. hyalinus JEL632]
MILVPLALMSSLLLILASMLAVPSLRKKLLLPLYHRVDAWQITSELLQLSWTSVPAPELVMSRAMVLTQLDNLNEVGSSGEKSRSDFIDQLYAALQDAWQRDDSTGSLCLGVFRAFDLDCVTRDLGRRLVLMDVLTSNPSIALIRIPKLVVITGAPYSGAHVLRKCELKHHENSSTSNNKLYSDFENKHSCFVTSLESIESIESIESKSKVGKNASFQETQLATLWKFFATQKERETHLANDSFRYACTTYLNCTLTALHALDRFPRLYFCFSFQLGQLVQPTEPYSQTPVPRPTKALQETPLKRHSTPEMDPASPTLSALEAAPAAARPRIHCSRSP